MIYIQRIAKVCLKRRNYYGKPSTMLDDKMTNKGKEQVDNLVVVSPNSIDRVNGQWIQVEKKTPTHASTLIMIYI